MNETAVAMSADEEAVLMIAAHGNAMSPIGRWEEPVLGLARRGYLRKDDRFNYSITVEGEKAAGLLENEQDEALRLMLSPSGPALSSRPSAPTRSEGLIETLIGIVDRALASSDPASREEALVMLRDGLAVLRQKIAVMQLDNTLVRGMDV